MALVFQIQVIKRMVVMFNGEWSAGLEWVVELVWRRSGKVHIYNAFD